MKYDILKYLLSFGKIKGYNNNVCTIINGKRCPLNVWFAKFRIKGNNNTVIFSYKKFRLKYLFIPAGLKIHIKGNGNTYTMENPPTIKRSEAHLMGDGSRIYIKETSQKIADAKFYITDGSELTIGKNSQMSNSGLKIVSVDNYERKAKITIGDNFMAAQNCLMRTGDGHTLIDMNTNQATNEPEDIIIGNNVWIGANCTVLKGAEIADNSMIGACSLVTRKFTENNVIIAGNPAKIIKTGYYWHPDGYGKYMREYKNQK